MVTGNYKVVHMYVYAIAVPQTILPAVPVPDIPSLASITIHFFNSLFFCVLIPSHRAVYAFVLYAKISASSWLLAAPSSARPLALRNTIAVIDIASSL